VLICTPSGRRSFPRCDQREDVVGPDGTPGAVEVEVVVGAGHDVDHSSAPSAGPSTTITCSIGDAPPVRDACKLGSNACSVMTNRQPASAVRCRICAAVEVL